MAIQISGCSVINDDRCLTNIANACSDTATANTFVVRDANGKICVQDIVFPLGPLTPIGTVIEGGILIKKCNGVAFIIACTSGFCTWDTRDGVVTAAQTATGCTGWFVPTANQMQNPGYACRTFWGGSGTYWTSTPIPPSPTYACRMQFNYGHGTGCGKNNPGAVRVFRCVTY